MLGARFLPSFFGFLAGILLQSFYPVSLPVTFLFLVVSVAGFFLVLLFKREGEHSLDTVFAFGFIFLLCFSIGIVRYDLSEWKKENPLLESSVAKISVIEGVVADDPAEKSSASSFLLRVTSLGETFGRGLIRISGANILSLEHGDKVGVRGVLERPKIFIGDDGREFDYPSYLAKDGVYYLMNRPQVELLEEGGFGIRRFLYFVRKAFLSTIDDLFSAPHSALLAGLLVGEKQDLGKDLTEQFRRAGIIHVVVLSGSNITIVANAFATLLSGLSRNIALSGSTFGILIFMLMTGATSTVVRASIMALVVILGKYSGRSYDPLRALLLACILMLIGNPKLLVFDPSFQLSFLSTLGLILLSPYFEKWLSFLPERFEIRAIAVVTCATQAFVTPFLLYQVGQVSLVALVVNFLVLGFIPATMLVGFVAVVIGFVSAGLAYPAVFATYLLLSYELFISRIFASLPFASINVSFPFWLVVVCYVIIATLLMRPHWSNKERKEKNLPQEGEAVSEIISF